LNTSRGDGLRYAGSSATTPDAALTEPILHRKHLTDMIGDGFIAQTSEISVNWSVTAFRGVNCAAKDCAASLARDGLTRS
jgi:hypothetical protein